MESYDFDANWKKITKRWPQFGKHGGELMNELLTLLKAEEGHEAAIVMCRALKDGSKRLHAGDIEAGMEMIMPIIQDVEIYELLRSIALYFAIRYGGADTDPKSAIWQSPLEAEYFHEAVLPLLHAADDRTLSSAPSSACGIPTPSESDCTLPDEEQISSKTAHEASHSKSKSSSFKVNLEDMASAVIVGTEAIQKINERLEDIDQRLKNVIDRKQSHADFMANTHQRLDAIQEKHEKLRDNISTTCQMMTTSLPMMKDIVNRVAKIFEEHLNPPGAPSNAKQTTQVEEELCERDTSVNERNQPQPTANSYMSNSAASASFESTDPVCRSLRTQIYHAQLAACRDHDTARFKPGVVGNCCAAAIFQYTSCEREASIAGHMVLANRHGDQARREIDTPLRNMQSSLEELHLNTGLRLLREIK